MYLGIDLGTTVLKVALFDGRSGRLAGRASAALPACQSPDGRREQQPAAVDRALGLAIGKLRREAGADWRRVRGLGLAAQGGSTIIAHKEDAQPLTPLILWNDMRALSDHQAIIEQTPPDFWRSLLRRDDPGMGLARLHWMQEHWPELFREGRILLGAGDYVYHLLTGQYCQDACQALQSGIYDAHCRRLTDKALQVLKLDVGLDFYAPLRVGHELHPLGQAAARRFGLSAGLPVAGPYNDHEAGFLATSHISHRPLACSLGTAWVGNFVLPEGAAGDSPFQLTIPSPLGAGRLVIQPLLTGNIAWDWALATFIDAVPNRALARQEQIFKAALLAPPGLTALPWLNRPNPLNAGHLGGCGFFGMGPSTSREDLVRAVAAGLVYEFSRIFEPLSAHGLVDCLALCGGASNGRAFQELFAVLFEPRPVYRVLEGEWMGTRGCLHALNKNISRISVQIIKPSRGTDRSAILEGRRTYNELFTRLYGHVRAGQAFQCKG